MKTCRACNIKKVNAEFYKHRTNKDGLSGYCKPCAVSFNSKRYASLEKKAKVMVLNAKGRAKKKKLEFCLTEEMIAPRVINGVCELTGIAFDLSYKSASRKNPFSPSIDRIDSSKGYVLSNIRVVLTAVNNALGEDGEEVVYPILKAMVEAIEKNAEQKQLTSVPTECVGQSETGTQSGTIHGTGVREDCDGSHHHRGEPKGENTCNSSKKSCRICMGSGVRQLEALELYESCQDYGLTEGEVHSLKQLFGCICC